MSDSDLVRKHQEYVQKVMSQAPSRNINFKDPRKVAQDITTRAVDHSTGKVYTGMDGLRLQEKQRQVAEYNQRNK